MIATITILLVIIMICGIALINIHSATTSLNSYSNSISFKNDLQLVKLSLLAASTTFTVTTEQDIEGEIIITTTVYPALPAGANLNNHHTLPAFLLKNKNTYNQPYIYCPYSVLEEATYAEVIADGSASYQANIANLTKNNKQIPYVMSTPKNSFTEDGILGFIISPSTKINNNLKCESVIYDSNIGSFLIEGGRVESITRFEVEGFNK